MSAKKSFFNTRVVLFNTMLISLLLAANLVFPARAHALGLAIEVTTSADNTIGDGRCSLREAIVNANKNWQFHRDCGAGFSDDGIFFSNALGTATITLNSALPPITDSAGLTINGGNDIIVSGNNLHQVFSIFGVAALTLDNLVVKDGNSLALNIGGGVWNIGKLTIRNSTLSGNRAESGGGVYNSLMGIVTITNGFGA